MAPSDRDMKARQAELSGGAKKKAKKKAATKGGDKAARGEDTPEWQKPEYTGPLSGEQAAWRNRHLTEKRMQADAESAKARREAK